MFNFLIIQSFINEESINNDLPFSLKINVLNEVDSVLLLKL